MKTKTYDFKDFIRDEHKKEVKPPTLSVMPLAAAPFIPTTAFAAEESIQSQMITAFSPLFDLIQGLAYPVALACVLAGGLFITIGNSEKGFSMMQKAGLGYVVVMIAPMMFNVLVSAMEGVV